MKQIFLALPLLLLTACGDDMTYPVEIERETSAAQATSAAPVTQIPVLVSDTINDGKFQVLGPIESTVGKLTAFHPTPTAEQAKQKLQIEAAELGADAVINARIGSVQVCPFSWACRVSTGTAVKLHN
ncbi:heavy metal-binding domain-containing protein [Pseudophaeobacter sp.]|uniref:heavy metal-binding domain-containing protein n=1 Tax=Pseudophaeobacter sp. TaxID=1971739 RepID=UPI004059D2C7